MSDRKPCCDEPECRRKQPIGLYLGDFSDTVYVVTKYRLRAKPGTGDREHKVAVDRHDITEQMKSFVRANAAWVRDVLKEDT
jgi:hypothetical protein